MFDEVMEVGLGGEDLAIPSDWQTEGDINDVRKYVRSIITHITGTPCWVL